MADKSDAVRILDRFFSSGQRLSMAELCARLDASRSTVMRRLRYLRDHLGAPVHCDPVTHRHCYHNPGGRRFELPGLWFSQAEISALAALDSMLEQLEPGIVRSSLAGARDRIRRLGPAKRVDRLFSRVKLLAIHRRPVAEHVFLTVATGLQNARRLTITYDQKPQPRTVSPQTLLRYRDNWYLDAWCHARRGLRTFALCRIGSCTVTNEPARRMSRPKLDKYYADSYGIFSGKAGHTAQIRFTGVAARYACHEQWHPRQVCEVQADGSILLHIPYGDKRELIKDIMAWGPDARILHPPDLAQALKNRLRETALVYEKPGDAVVSGIETGGL